MMAQPMATDVVEQEWTPSGISGIWHVKVRGTQFRFTVAEAQDRPWRIARGVTSMISESDECRSVDTPNGRFTAAERVISAWVIERRKPSRFVVKPFKPGDHVEWTHEGIRYTGQVWCESVEAYHGAPAVVVQHANGRPVAHLFTLAMRSVGDEHQIQGATVTRLGNTPDPQQLGLFVPSFAGEQPEPFECEMPVQLAASDPQRCPGFPRENYVFKKIFNGFGYVTFDMYEKPATADPYLGEFAKGRFVCRVESEHGGQWQASVPADDEDERVASGASREEAAYEWLRGIATTTLTRRNDENGHSSHHTDITVTMAGTDHAYTSEWIGYSAGSDNAYVVRVGTDEHDLSQEAVIGRVDGMPEAQELAIRHAQGRLPVLGAEVTPDDYTVTFDWSSGNWDVVRATRAQGCSAGSAPTWREGNALAIAHAQRCESLLVHVEGRLWSMPPGCVPSDCDHEYTSVKVEARENTGVVTLECPCGQHPFASDTLVYSSVYRVSTGTAADVQESFVRDTVARAGYHFTGAWHAYGDAMYASVVKAPPKVEGTRVERRIDYPGLREGMGSTDIVQRGTIVARDTTPYGNATLSILWDGDWGQFLDFEERVLVVDQRDIARERHLHIFAIGDRVIRYTEEPPTGDERVGVVLEAMITSTFGGLSESETLVRICWSDGFDDGPEWEPAYRFASVVDGLSMPSAPERDEPATDAPAADGAPVPQVPSDVIVHAPMTRGCTGFPRAGSYLLGTHEVALEIAEELHALGREMLGARYEEFGYLPVLQRDHGWWVEYGIRDEHGHERLVRVTRRLFDRSVHTTWGDVQRWGITLDGFPLTTITHTGHRAVVTLPHLSTRREIAHAIHTALSGSRS